MVVINRSELSKALSRAATIARNSGNDSPIMGEVSSSVLYLWYSSFDVSIWEQVPVESDGELSFSCPVETFNNLVSSWTSETIRLETGENNTLIIKSGKSKVTVPYYEGVFDEMETLPDAEFLVKVEPPFLSYLVETEKFAAKTEEQPSLSCVLIETLFDNRFSITAADAFHIYHRELEGESNILDDIRILIPIRNIITLSKLFSTRDSLTIARADNDYILFTNDSGLSVLCAVFNDKYPKISSIIEDIGTLLFNVSRDTFIEALSVGSVLSTNGIIQFSQSDDSIYVSFPKSTSDSEIFLENVNIVEEIPDSIYLNITFLKHCLEIQKSPMLSFSLLNNGAIRIVGDDPRFATIVNVLRY